jgi:hypothetical protein
MLYVVAGERPRPHGLSCIRFNLSIDIFDGLIGSVPIRRPLPPLLSSTYIRRLSSPFTRISSMLHLNYVSHAPSSSSLAHPSSTISQTFCFLLDASIFFHVIHSGHTVLQHLDCTSNSHAIIDPELFYIIFSSFDYRRTAFFQSKVFTAESSIRNKC